MTAEELFWELIEPMYADPAIRRSTMMGLPCVRLDGRFFASLDRRSGALLVKLPAVRVGQLIDTGQGEPFAPAGRVFREWAAVPVPDRRRWQRLLAEARDHAAGTQPAATPARRATTGTAAFTGFGAAGLAFLAGLEHDNTKRYFDAHRAVYQRELLEPAKLFAAVLGKRLQQRISAGVRAEPRIGGSLLRIGSRDPALLLRITPAEIHLGTGVFNLTGPALDRYRSALNDQHQAADLDGKVAALLAGGAELSGPTRRRPPAGFSPTGPAARYAVRDGFQLIRRYRRPAAVTSARLIGWSEDKLAPFAPVHQWLVRHAT